MKKLFLGVLMAGSSFWANAQAQVVVAWYYQEWSITQDSLNYKYNTGTNQLQYITDNVLATVSTTDIDNQNPNNYIYDKSGNMVADNSQSMSVSWSPYGKILQTNKAGGANLQFGYNAMQQRVIKRVSQNDDTTRTYYIRDAQGNTMGVYTRHNDSVTWREQYIFGSSRLGLYRADTLVNKGLQVISKLYEGKRNYELTNHLGNVLAVINDRKTDSLSGTTKVGFNAVVISASDYYPFGMGIDSRTYSFSSYRYGFNGKENDKETGEQDYGNRIYDPRTGKFLSIDPIYGKYPELTPYQFASNRPIQGIDLDGLEFVQPPVGNLAQMKVKYGTTTVTTSGRIETTMYLATDLCNKTGWISELRNLDDLSKRTFHYTEDTKFTRDPSHWAEFDQDRGSKSMLSAVDRFDKGIGIGLAGAIGIGAGVELAGAGAFNSGIRYAEEAFEMKWKNILSPSNVGSALSDIGTQFQNQMDLNQGDSKIAFAKINWIGSFAQLNPLKNRYLSALTSSFFANTFSFTIEKRFEKFNPDATKIGIGATGNFIGGIAGDRGLGGRAELYFSAFLNSISNTTQNAINNPPIGTNNTNTIKNNNSPR